MNPDPDFQLNCGFMDLWPWSETLGVKMKKTCLGEKMKKEKEEKEGNKEKKGKRKKRGKWGKNEKG